VPPFAYFINLDLSSSAMQQYQYTTQCRYGTAPQQQQQQYCAPQEQYYTAPQWQPSYTVLQQPFVTVPHSQSYTVPQQQYVTMQPYTVPQQQQYVTVSQQQYYPQTQTVTLPAGAVAGAEYEMDTGDGRVITFRAPQGGFPGSQIQVTF
jgi:hypothetical protein